MATKHIALWGAWYGSRNVGDQAMLMTIPKMLEAELSTSRFSVFTDNAAHVNEYGPQESGLDIRAFQNKLQLHRLMHTLATCDLFVIGGGVPFYEQPYHLKVMKLLVGAARFFHTPYMTWAVSSQQISSPRAKKVFKWVLDGAAAVTYHDPVSGQTFQDCGVEKSNLTLCADPVFHLIGENKQAAIELVSRFGTFDPSRPVAVIGCRQMHHNESYSAEHHNPKSFDTVKRMIDCFAQSVDWFWEAGYQPILAPMNTVAPDDDREMGRKIIKQAKHGQHAILIDTELRPYMALAVMSLGHIGIVSRLHAGVLAYIGNCPHITYSIGPKMDGMAQMMQLDPFLVNDESTNPDVVREKLMMLHTNREAVASMMKIRLEELKTLATIPAGIASVILS